MQVSTFTMRRVVGLAGAAVLAAGSLAACGGSSDAKTADGLTKVTLLRSTGATFEGLYIAEQQGFFKDAGLSVEIKAGATDTSQNVPSVLNGEAEFAMTDSAGLLKAIAQGIPVEAVSQIQASVTGAPVSDGILVPGDSSVKTAKDLDRNTVGLPALEVLGGLNLVALPAASLQDAATKGRVDAISTFAAFYDGAKAAGMRAIGNGSNDFPGLPQSLVFSSTKWLDGHEDVAKKFADAFAKGLEYANAHPADIRAVDAKYTKMPANVIKNRTIQTFDPSFAVDQIRLAAEKMYEYGIVEKKIDTDKVLWKDAPTD